MNRTLLLKSVLPGVLALSLGATAGWGYGQHLLSSERRLQEGKATELNKKITVLQKRYTEEHELRVNLEGQKRSHRAELERCGKEHAEMNETSEQLKREIATLESRNKELGEALSRFDAAWQGLQEKLQQMVGAVRDRDDAIKALRTARQQLENELQGIREQVEHTDANNARLCLIAQELLEAYQQKGCFRTLLENEPLTQIKKVELEHFVQAYRDRIQKEQVKPIRNGQK